MTRKLTRLIYIVGFIVGCVLVAAWHAAAIYNVNWRLLGANSTAVAGLFGFGVALVICLQRPIASRLYIFLHELSHVIAALLVGRRVRRLRVGARGGSVQVERPNAFVALAPYILPLAPIAVAVVIAPCWLFFPHAMLLTAGAACVAVAFAWHLSHTVFSMRTGQPDFEHAGIAVSVAVIITANVVALYWGIAIMDALAPGSEFVIASENAGRAVVAALK